jgi:thiamine biosynthesis lipoprotein
MDTVMELTVYGGEEALAAAEARIRELEGELSVTDEDSEIYALNRTGSAALGQDAAELLGKALALCGQTGGALDVSIYPVVRAWGFTTGEYGVPDTQTIQELLAHVDYTQVTLDEDSGQASLPAGMEIDLGSVAKGYTGDQVIALLRREGVTSALLNLGGNIQTLGNKPDGSPWRIGVQDPVGDGYVGILELTDQAAITSGGYERYFEEDGQTYWHIIDPATGAPARSGLISVTIVGDSGMVCDGLSTALFVMGLDAAAQYWREVGGFETVLIDEDGQIFITEGLEGKFTPTDAESEDIQVIRHG